jgi:hypothetical protein
VSEQVTSDGHFRSHILKRHLGDRLRPGITILENFDANPR